MSGSAVFAKLGDGYWKGYVGMISGNRFEFIYQPGSKTQYTMINKGQAVLDEEPDSSDLAIKTLVLGKEINSGDVRVGRIVRKDDALCTIKTNDDVWSSNLNDVRVAKEPEFCPP